MYDNDTPLLAAVEGGGSSFRVLVGRITKDGPTILHRLDVASTDNPHTCLKECAEFLRIHCPPRGYHGLGVATFGPVGLDDENTELYGSILGQSPKQNWRNINLLTPLKEACIGNGINNLKVLVETDVNAPAMAELEWYKANLANQTISVDNDESWPQISSLAYVTVGTGVGVGLVIHNQAVHGLMHPEGGHVCLQPLENDTFKGYSWGLSTSPYQGKNTIEGVASSVALIERYAEKNGNSNIDLSTIPDSDDIWDHCVNALANLCVTLLLTTSIERIVLGGGIMQRTSLLPRIQQLTLKLLNGYLVIPHIERIIVTSAYGADAGAMGALVLAQKAAQKKMTQDQVKQRAFGVGLQLGFFIGATFAGLVAKYAYFNKRRYK